MRERTGNLLFVDFLLCVGGRLLARGHRPSLNLLFEDEEETKEEETAAGAEVGVSSSRRDPPPSLLSSSHLHCSAFPGVFLPLFLSLTSFPLMHHLLIHSPLLLFFYSLHLFSFLYSRSSISPPGSSLDSCLYGPLKL